MKKTNKALRKEIHELSSKIFFKVIPIDEIRNILDRNGRMLLQEDNTEWEGILCGEDSRTNFTIGNKETMEPTGEYLSLSWYRMPVTGRFEIVCYIN